MSKLNSLIKISKLNFNSTWKGRLIGAGIGAGIGGIVADKEDKAPGIAIGATSGYLGGKQVAKIINKKRFKNFLEKERSSNKTWRGDARKLLTHLKENNIKLTREKSPSRAEIIPGFLDPSIIHKKININRKNDVGLNIPALTRLSHEIGHFDDFTLKKDPINYIIGKQNSNKGILELERKANSNALKRITDERSRNNYKDLQEPAYGTYLRLHGNLKEKITKKSITKPLWEE